MTSNKFREEYNSKHKYCPKCGSTKFSTTLLAYTYIPCSEEEYKDLNNCICSNCKDKHVFDIRVSIDTNEKLGGITEWK